MFGGNWEERLAAARAQREKIRRDKDLAAEEKNLVRPAFLSADPADLLEQSRETAVDSLTKRDAVAANNTPETNQFLRPELFAERVSSPAAAAIEPKSSTLKMAGVAFMCFFGLGFGMVLSFGAVLALGWVPFPEVTSDDLNLEEPGRESSASSVFPEVFASDLDGIAPGTVGNDGAAAYNGTNAADVTGVARKTPGQPADVSPDGLLAYAQISAPRPDASEIEGPVASRLDFQPSSIPVSFSELARSSSAPQQRLITPDLSGGGLPHVPEVSNIDTVTRVASLIAPVPDEGAIALAAYGGEVLNTRNAPQISASVPDAAPTLLGSAPTAVDALDSGLPERLASLDLDTASATPATRISPPPTRADAFRVPVLPETVVSLPAVGAPYSPAPETTSEAPTGSGVFSRIRLVKIAPTNVSQGRMSDTSRILTATGFQVATVDRVDYRVSQTHVRYYYRANEDVAKVIAAALGGTARDFTDFRPSPPEGTVELYLEGQRGSVAQATSAPRPSATNTERDDALKATLQERVINNLRTDGIFQN